METGRALWVRCSTSRQTSLWYCHKHQGGCRSSTSPGSTILSPYASCHLNPNLNLNTYNWLNHFQVKKNIYIYSSYSVTIIFMLHDLGQLFYSWEFELYYLRNNMKNNILDICFILRDALPFETNCKHWKSSLSMSLTSYLIFTYELHKITYEAGHSLPLQGSSGWLWLRASWVGV